MDEVTKLYENAGVKKGIIPCPANYYGYDCTGNNRDDKDCSCATEGYPLFTAEKQIELIKWLGKLDGKLEIFCTYNKEKFIFNFYFNRKTNKNPDPKYSYSNLLDEDIEILIASIINDLWQDLTDAEKAEIKNILEM